MRVGRSEMILFPVLALGVWILVSLFFYKMGYEGYYTSILDEPRTKTNWNAIALFVNIRNGELKLPKRKSSIDKEIAEEEKEIAELEQQKEKIDRLAELKYRKEKLFKEVHSGANADCQWCGSEDCLESAYTVDGISQYYCTSCHRWLYDGSSKA